MGNRETFPPSKLIFPILLSEGHSADPVRELITREFGSLDYESPLFPFTYSSYYDQEMGQGIHRVFFSPRELIEPERLADIKILCNEWETGFCSEHAGKKYCRMVNIDPGILSLGSLILASTKNSGHRIPLSQGIYAEITLLYANREFRPLLWTYPDFKSPEYMTILKEMRELLRKELRERRI